VCAVYCSQLVTRTTIYWLVQSSQYIVGCLIWSKQNYSNIKVSVDELAKHSSLLIISAHMKYRTMGSTLQLNKHIFRIMLTHSFGQPIIYKSYVFIAMLLHAGMVIPV